MRLILTTIILTMLALPVWAEQWPRNRCQSIEERAAADWRQYQVQIISLKGIFDAANGEDLGPGKREKAKSTYDSAHQIDLALAARSSYFG